MPTPNSESSTVVTLTAGQLGRNGAMAARSFGRRGLMAAVYSLIAKFAELTGATDREVGALLGMPRSTVQAFRTGRVSENLSDHQKDTIIRAAQAYRDDVFEAVAEMELFT